MEKISIEICTCYYFDYMLKIEDFDFDSILLDKKSDENILIYNISYKTLTGTKPLRMRFDKVHGLIRLLEFLMGQVFSIIWP